MRIADREQCSLHRNRVVHRGALADAPIIHVPTKIAGWNRIDHICLSWRQCDYTEMGSDRNTHVLEDSKVLLYGCMVNRHTGIINYLVDDSMDRSVAPIGSCRLPSPSSFRLAHRSRRS